MSELKPCPFCGRTPIVDDCGDHRFFVRCKCGISQDKLYAQKCDAIRVWNRQKKKDSTIDAILIDAFCEKINEAHNVGYEVGYWAGRRDYEKRWIPCSERLPEVRQWVLCQCRAGIMDVLRLTADGNWSENYPHTEYMSSFVVAWMPLPKPYEPPKEDEDEK